MCTKKCWEACLHDGIIGHEHCHADMYDEILNKRVHGALKSQSVKIFKTWTDPQKCEYLPLHPLPHSLHFMFTQTYLKLSIRFDVYGDFCKLYHTYTPLTLPASQLLIFLRLPWLSNVHLNILTITSPVLRSAKHTFSHYIQLHRISTSLNLISATQQKNLSTLILLCQSFIHPCLPSFST